MFKAIDLSTSGMAAQRHRMDVIASNIANINTTRGPDGQPAPFQRRLVTFRAENVSQEGSQGPASVSHRVEIDTKTPPRRVNDPGHPDADNEGFVNYPNINMVSEYVNAMLATRAYEANVAALESSREMSNLALRVLS